MRMLFEVFSFNLVVCKSVTCGLQWQTNAELKSNSNLACACGQSLCGRQVFISMAGSFKLPNLFVKVKNFNENMDY
jgi:hypothetical protein